MSEPLLTFEERDRTLHSTYRFYDDRIERDWRDLCRSGTDVILTKNLSARITEQTTFGYGNANRMRHVVRYSVAGSVLRFGFTHAVLHTIAYLSFTCAVMVLGCLVYNLQNERWLYVKNRDGETVLTFRESGLHGVDREMLERAIIAYAETNMEIAGIAKA